MSFLSRNGISILKTNIIIIIIIINISRFRCISVQKKIFSINFELKLHVRSKYYRVCLYQNFFVKYVITR